MPNVERTLSTCGNSVVVSPVLPLKTEIATGIHDHPSTSRNYLQLALLSVAVMTESCEGTRHSLEVARRKIIEHEAVIFQVPGCKFLLDTLLSLQEPIHCLIQIILVAPSKSRSSGNVVVDHQRSVASLLRGDTIRAATMAMTRSRSRTRSRIEQGIKSKRRIASRTGIYGAMVLVADLLEERIRRCQRLVAKNGANAFTPGASAATTDWPPCACGSSCRLDRTREGAPPGAKRGWAQRRCTWRQWSTIDGVMKRLNASIYMGTF